MIRATTRRHMTEIGTEVEVRYRRVSEEEVEILSYRRRKPGRENFRRDRSEEGRTVPWRCLPWSEKETS